MVYYAIVYMTNGEIHMKPYPTAEEAKSHCKEILATKWGPKVLRTKVCKKDTTKKLHAKTRWVMDLADK